MKSSSALANVSSEDIEGERPALVESIEFPEILASLSESELGA